MIHGSFIKFIIYGFTGMDHCNGSTVQDDDRNSPERYYHGASLIVLQSRVMIYLTKLDQSSDKL
uniref:Uncharacterized protein n=1 Tax=Onchocerca volvulus TaxID=6282 RepID=A0A8R1TSP2_ONCVO